MTSLEQDYKEYLKEAGEYKSAAMNGFRTRREVFTTEILYNILGLSIEKYVMGFMMYKGQLPQGHTFYDLLEALKTQISVPEKVSALLLEMEAYQNLCPAFDQKTAKDISKSAIEKMIYTTECISDIVSSNM